MKITAFLCDTRSLQDTHKHTLAFKEEYYTNTVTYEQKYLSKNLYPLMGFTISW